MARIETTRTRVDHRTISPKRAVLATAILLFSALAIVGPARAADVAAIEWKPERAPDGPTMIVIGLEEQRAQIFRNGVRIGTTPVSTGRKGYRTPTGLFTILEKKREHYSRKYDNAPMPNMQRLTWDGIALHAGRLPGYPASHGCIRLPHEMSDRLFDITSKGGLVAVVDSFPDTTVLDMASAPTGGGPDPHSGDAELPTRAAGAYGPVSVVLSTRDASVVVMRNGIEIGRAPVDIEPGSSSGEWIYVGRPGNVWEPLPSLENSPLMTPADRFAAGQLRVDPAFGQQLEALLVPGTTVVITDEPVDARRTDDPMLATPIAAEYPSTVDAAP
jgi:hypothetical protein